MKLCLTIGVSQSPPLASLPGAITAVREVSAWARQSGFETREITDEGGNPVTIARIRETLLGMLPANDVVTLFVLHFAGHGFRTGAEQNVWLPSDWNTEMRGISVEGLRRRLYRHGIQSLTIFGDACRSLPNDVETADIAIDPVLPRGPYDEVSPVVDRFSAVMDGQPAFMLKGDGQAPARCIFSTVLIEGLQGQDDSAFDAYVKDCVTPESLALFATQRMQTIGALYKLKCSPDYSIGIPRGHTVYHTRGTAAGELTPPQWPAPPGPVTLPPAELALPDHAWALTYPFRKKVIRDRPELLGRFSVATLPLAPDTNLVVLGGTPKQLWSAGVARWTTLTDATSEGVVAVDAGLSAQVLVEFQDGIVASAVVYDDLVTVLTRDDNGVIGWTCINRWEDADVQMKQSLSAISDLQQGRLTVSQVDQLATSLREMKHIDPTLGAIASYLYDYAGDLDSIRRMAAYYCDRNQPIPFDIAFMGLLPTSHKGSGYAVTVPAVPARPADPAQPHWVTAATPATTGKVAGWWPWLRQGWQFVEDPANEEKMVADSLYDAIPFLLPSQFSSFKLEGANILIQKFHMKGYL